MTYFQAVILGLVQGLSEFLPISSSGHLAILENFFGIKENLLFFAVMLHFGTLLAVFVAFWKDILELIQELILTIKDLIGRNGLRLDERPVRKLGVMIIVSCIPTAIIGFAFGDIFEGLYSKPIAIARKMNAISRAWPGTLRKRTRLKAPATATPAPRLPLTIMMTTATIAGSVTNVTTKLLV